MKRPENHIKQTESFSYFESTLSEWALNRLNEDYGIDYDVQIFENGEGTDLNFGAQIKATDSPNVDGTYYKFNLETKYIDYLFKQKRPMFLIVYDRGSKNAFWISIQDYVWDTLNNENPGWLSQGSSTIKIPLSNVLTDKVSLKMAVNRCYNRIVVENFYKIPLGDGLGLKETLEDIEKLKEHDKKIEYKLNHNKILLAQKLAITGDYNQVFKKLNEVYQKKNNDLVHLKSIIALISYSNIADLEQNKKIVELAEEGLKLSEKQNEKVAYAILLVYRAQAIHFIINKRISEALYSKKAMKHLDIGVIINIETDKKIRELSNLLQKVSLEVRDAFKILIAEKEFYTLTYLLTISLSMTTVMVSQLQILIEGNKFSDEIKEKDILARHLIDLIGVFKDEELEISIRESVANYYYYTQRGKDGLEIIKPALKIAEKREEQPQIKKIKFMIDMMTKRPNPLKPDKEKKFDDLSTDEYTTLTVKHIELMGTDLNDGSDISKALNWGLKDMNPAKCLKYCEELYLNYDGTSYLGQMTGVPSIGYKLLWCKHGEVIVDSHLDIAFDTYQNNYCKNCKYKKPRDNNWICKVGWFRDREVPQAIKDFKENMKKW